MKVLPAFDSDAAWDIAGQYVTTQAVTLRVHHAAEQQSQANEQDDDNHCMRHMDRHRIPPSAGWPSRSGVLLSVLAVEIAAATEAQIPLLKLMMSKRSF